MPAAQKKIHNLTGRTTRQLEECWSKAKSIALHKTSKADRAYWTYVEGIFKNMARAANASPGVSASSDFEQSLSAFVSVSKPMQKKKKSPFEPNKKPVTKKKPAAKKSPTKKTSVKKPVKVKTKVKVKASPTKKVVPARKNKAGKVRGEDLPDWWKRKSPKGKEDYLKAHPTSKFAAQLAKTDKKAAEIIKKAKVALGQKPEEKPEAPQQQNAPETQTPEDNDAEQPTDSEHIDENIQREVNPSGGLLFGLARKVKKAFNKNIKNMSNTMRHHKQGMAAIGKWGRDDELSEVEKTRAKRTAGVAAKLVVGTLVGLALFTPLAGLAVELGTHFFELGPAGDAVKEAVSSDEEKKQTEIEADPETEFLTKMHDWLLNQDLPALIAELQRKKDEKKEEKNAG